MEAVFAATGRRRSNGITRPNACGAGMTMASPETVLELSNRILANAAGARRETDWWWPARCAT